MGVWSVSCGLAFLVAVVLAVDVETEYGTVRGQTILLDDGVGVNSFKSIKFARAPVGDLRFANPEKPDPWDDVFIADSLGMQCPQSPAGLLWLTHPGWIFYDEDCLHLSIFTPEDMGSGPYPVLVWFHGGGYTGGGNIQYPGHFMASHDTVVVVPNYRLGAFGFMATPDGTLRGNYGMMDQVMALQFVQDNIANFGGDPDRVTIYGQSAGGSSSALHIVSPMSQNLFAQAIQESGADTNFWAVNWPEQEPETYSYQTAEKVGCLGADDVEMVACMRALPWRQIRDNQGIDCAPGHFCQGYAPIIDGEGGFLPDHPTAIRESGQFNKGNIISGICRDDGSFYTLGLIPESDEGDGFTREEYLRYLEDRLLSIWAPQMNQSQYDNLLAAVDFYYGYWVDREDLWENRESFNKMITDAAFGLAMDRQAKLHSRDADVYMYIQGFRSPNATSFIPEWMGVPHNGELPYVWGWPRLLRNPAVRDDSAIVFDIVGWVDPIDIDYADYFQTLWSNFARVGNPTPSAVDPPGNNNPTEWPQFTEDSQSYIDFDYDIEVLMNYRQRDLAFWYSYAGDMTGIPFSANANKKADHGTGRLNSAVFDRAIQGVVTKALKESFVGFDMERAINYYRQNVK